MVKKTTVTIGIPAFNEEKNIQNLLSSLMSQNQENFDLKKILVISDGSTDKTNSIVRSYSKKVKLIQLISDGKRLGKTARLNQIFHTFKSEILILFDADVELSSRDVLAEIVKKFKKSNVGLVGANTFPKKPLNFVGKAIYSAVFVYLYVREHTRNGNNIYGCTGACIGLRAAFARELSIPLGVVLDDDYIYLKCKEDNYRFVYAKKAKVSYSLPKNTSDYVKQMFRSTPEATYVDLYSLYGEHILKEFQRPLGVFLVGFFQEFFKNPLGIIYITLIRVLAKPFYPFVTKNYKLRWFTAVSTRT